MRVVVIMLSILFVSDIVMIMVVVKVRQIQEIDPNGCFRLSGLIKGCREVSLAVPLSLAWLNSRGC